MIQALLSKFISAISVPILFLSGLFAPHPIIDNSVGVALPSGTATFETTLASAITTTATTLTLTSNSIRGGSTLSGYQCFTIDEGSAQAEFVCGTASSTSVTGLERGVSPADGVTQIASLQFAHRRGANVKITDFPLIQRLKSQNAGSGTYDSVLSYANGVTPTGGSELADVEYVLSVITGTSTLSYNRTVVSGTAGENVSTGTIVYLKPSDQRWWKTNANDASTYTDRTIGVAQGAGTAGGNIGNGVLTHGLDSTQKGMTAGTYLFISTTSGATTTATTTQVIGQAWSATTMYVDKDLVRSAVYTPMTFTSTTTFTGAVTGIASSTIRVYSSSTVPYTYTKPTSPTFKYITVELIGGGGGGGGNNNSSDTTGSSSGGGAGAYCKFTLSNAQLSATTSLIVGIGGTGGIQTGGQGLTGSSTVFGTYATSTGGQGGIEGGNVAGGKGGVAQGICQVSANGNSGQSTFTGAIGSVGGTSFLGGSCTSEKDADADGGHFGSGGCGAGDSTSGGTPFNGGVGGGGVAIITEFY